MVVVCFRGPLHPKHTKNCAFRRAVARVHYPRDMPQAPSQGTTKGTTRGKRGFRITRTRVTHARDIGARNDARDDARRRIIEATRARAAAVAATAAAAARAGAWGTAEGRQEREARFGMMRARVTHARITNVRDGVEDYARRRVHAAAATPPPPRRCRRRRRAPARWETTGETTRGKRGFWMTRVRVTRARVTSARNDAR